MSRVKGWIATVAGKRCRLLLPDLTECNALLRGKLFLDETAAVAVGDRVDATDVDGQWVVEAVEPRTNEFVRQGLRKERQVLFANADRVLILASLAQPRTKEAAVDRFLVAALRGGTPPLLVLSKQDLDERGEREAELRDLYAGFDLPVHAVSAVSGAGVAQLRAEIAAGCTALVGNSGVGKSSLINLLIPGLELPTREISAWSGKGTHTTTAALLVPFSTRPPAFLIDTPGMKSFVPYGISRGNLIQLFPDLSALAADCRFTNCGHTTEPGCALHAAVSSGTLPASRLRSYHRLMSELTRS